MKKASFAAALLAGGLLLQSCDNTTVAPDSADQTTTNAGARKGGGSYNAHLTGDQEVPAPSAPPVVTNATGQINLKLSADGTELYYKLIVANIESVRFAHLHLAPAGSNGQVVVTLTPHMMPTLISPQGVIAEGVITAASLSGTLAGKQVSDLVAAIEAGNVYTNVHSNKYPGGELRGQVD